MKKLVLFAAVALSMTVFSCGKGEKGAAVDSDSVVAEEQVAPADSDTVKADTVKAVETPAAEQK